VSCSLGQVTWVFTPSRRALLRRQFTSPADMNNFGVTFEAGDVDSTGTARLPDGTPGLTRASAVATALEHTAAADATHRILPNVNVSTAFGRLSDSQIARMTPMGKAPVFENVPAWVVSFTGPGLVIGSSGPVGSAHSVHNEESVVIDARTGEWLFSYS
jgi:hypothetical protein